MGARAGLSVSAGALLVLALCSFAVREEDHLAALRGVLQKRTPAEERTPSDLTARLAALGPEAVPSLYEVVTGRGLEALIGGDWKPAAWHCKPEEIPVLCAAALERAPTAAVLAHVERVLAGEPTFRERLVLMRILGAQGSAAGLALLLRDAGDLGEVELGLPSVRLALKDALVAILTRDAATWTLLEKGLEQLAPVTCEVLVEALGAAGLPRGMDVLARLFRRGSPAPARVAEAMAELESARPWILAGRTLEHCSGWFTSQDAARCAQAARLAGRLHALEAVPALIELTAHADLLVRRCAADALQKMAGHPLALEPGASAAWYEREQAWKEKSWEPLLATLATVRPGPANEALRELAAHPLYRHELAHALAESLCQQPPAVALASCVELEALGSRRALPGLVAALADAPPPLRAAISHALCTLTGEKRELAAEPWRAVIGS